MSHSWIDDELEHIRQAGLLRRKTVCQSLGQGKIARQGQTLLDFSANDYLGLANDPRVIEAGCQAAHESGLGARASQLISGYSPWHEKLTAKLAQFEQTDNALLFPSGYTANLGTIAAVAGPEDVIFSDRFNHACLIDGCRLANSRFRIYRSQDLEHLESMLQKEIGFRRRFIITDAVFSMDGTIAPLKELCDLAERYDAIMIVDEAHGTGVLGEHGRGACEAAGVQHRVPIRIGTLSKALGTQGGFVTGTHALIEFLWNKARTQMFSTGLSPVLCAGAAAAIDIVTTEPQRRVHLKALCQTLHQALPNVSLDLAPSPDVPILPVILQDNDKTILVAQELEKQGFLVGAIRPPTVPQGTARLRISLSAVHTLDQIKSLTTAINTLSMEAAAQS
jgi:8-amino-7-oxononanoate synthase